MEMQASVRRSPEFIHVGTRISERGEIRLVDYRIKSPESLLEIVLRHEYVIRVSGGPTDLVETYTLRKAKNDFEKYAK